MSTKWKILFGFSVMILLTGVVASVDYVRLSGAAQSFGGVQTQATATLMDEVQKHSGDQTQIDNHVKKRFNSVPEARCHSSDNIKNRFRSKSPPKPPAPATAHNLRLRA